MEKEQRETMSLQESLLNEVVNDLIMLCSEYPLSIVKIASLSGVCRQTVQRLFDRKPVQVKSLYKIKRWLKRFDYVE